MNEYQRWLAANRLALVNRLRGLERRPDGVLFVEGTGTHFVIVTKAGSQIRLHRVRQSQTHSPFVQSRLDLGDPLRLVSPYNQATLLALLWQPQPQRIFTVGLGGGCLQMVLHHIFPAVLLECAELEPAVVTAARRFFGLLPDERLKVTVAEGRQQLAAPSPAQPYDLILVDVATEEGVTPPQLATGEFYALCRSRLTAGGLLVANFLETGSALAARLQTLAAQFDSVYLCTVAGNTLVFAGYGPILTAEEIQRRVAALQAEHQFGMPLPTFTAQLRPLRVDRGP